MVVHKVKMDNPDKKVIDNNHPDYISLDEGRSILKQNIYDSIMSPNMITLIKAQTGIGKTHAYILRVVNVTSNGMIYFASV